MLESCKWASKPRRNGSKWREEAEVFGVLDVDGRVMRNIGAGSWNGLRVWERERREKRRRVATAVPMAE